MTDAEFIQEVRQRLGEPMVKIELDTTQHSVVLNHTKKWFLAKKGLIGSKSMNLLAGDQVRFNTIDATYGVSSVVDVYFGVEPNIGDMYQDCVFGVFPYGFPVLYGSYSRVSGLYSASTYTQIVMSLEERKRQYGTEWDWWTVEGDTFDGNDWLVLDGPRGRSTLCLIRYKPRMTPAQFNLTWLKDRDYDLVIRYAAAEMKEILGGVRGKYASYPAPGGDVQLDGDKLKDEARVDKELLDKEIADSQGPMGLMQG